jgi:predicted alpha/beta-fold hydrolase
VVLVHGLEGSSRSQYILGTATRAWAAGCNVVRMNMRSCGGTDELSPGIYHSGRSEDVAAVVDGLVREHGFSRIALVGFSMGGNLVLKYAGERSSAIPFKPTNGLNGAPGLGPTTGLNGALVFSALPKELCAVVGISPLMDLAVSSKALHERANRIYERRFLRNMVARFKKKAEIFPEIYSSSAAEAVRAIRSANSMRAFDQEVVARYAPFADADDYYRKVASSRWASEFALPTLILHALDDPFIRMLPSTREALSENENVTFVETRHGGHCAFLAPGKGSERHWAEKSLVGWLVRVAG